MLDKKHFFAQVKRDQTKDIIYLIQKVIHSQALYTKELNRLYHLTVPQLGCLLALYENGPLSPSEIAKIIMVQSSTMSGIIDRLDLKGLVERSQSNIDRRIILISLTNGGEKLAQKAPSLINPKIIDGIKKIPTHERDQIAQALNKLSSMLDVEGLQEE
jgi:DNA-binding MarR family transcriptional regulator